jgi:hypothetical protein
MTTLVRTLGSPALDRPVTDGRYTPLSVERLRAAKRAYTTRRVDLDTAEWLLDGVAPTVGDLVLARVTEIGQHGRIELPTGRRATLFAGDEIVVAYGERYAPDQFEGRLPGDLGPCHLAAAGGVAAEVVAAHVRMEEATRIVPVGLLVDSLGRRVNVAAAALPPVPAPTGARPITVAVVGASMNSGKTTTLARLARGLTDAGIAVGAAKITGTGAGGDGWLLADAGASPVYDFTDAGYPSTYRIGHAAVRAVFAGLTDRLASEGCEAVVLEIADGIFQDETAALLRDPIFAERVDGVLFAAPDALGASAGVGWLRERGMAPVAVSGVLTSSPLAAREAAAATGCPVWTTDDLATSELAAGLYERLRAARPAALAAVGPSEDLGRSA